MTTSDDGILKLPIDGRLVKEPFRGDRGPAYVRTTIHVDRACHPSVAAGGQRRRCSEERGGDFYTDCDSCLLCDVPHVVVPDLMAYVAHPEDRHSHCVFTRAPQTPGEIERAIDAMCESEICGIRHGGHDPEILLRIAARKQALQDSTDSPLPDG